MDCARFWKMEDDVISTFTDPREIHSLNSRSSSFSTDGQFDSSFSSSLASYDECCTPSRCSSLDTSDLDGLSSSRTSLGSSGSNSPVDDAIFYSLTSMNGIVTNKADNKSHIYGGPCRKSTQGHSMMNYDYSQVNSLYGPPNFQDDFDGLPDMIFDSLPELLFHDTTSPLPMASSTGNFVVPSQTFISKPYRPITPVNMPKAILGSPLDGCSQPEGIIKYFMSPRERHSQLPSSSLPSKSHSTVRRMPTSQTLESSVALHRIQSTGGSRISKQSKRSRQITSQIDRVAPGTFRCDYPGCKTQRAFKRHEHLKRHQKIHDAPNFPPIICEYCQKESPYDRFDNYMAHVERHSKNEKGSRTKYFPEALEKVLAWKEKKRQANKKLGVPGEMYNRRVKTSSAKSKR